MKLDDAALNELVDTVLQGASYRQLSLDLVRRIARQEMAKRKSFKEAVRTTRSKIHQTAGAYQERKVPYSDLIQRMQALPEIIRHPETRSFCTDAMFYHASTQERLPILSDFFNTCLASIQPVTSILDLGCGFNPLCLPWMPASASIEYIACDIYSDMIDFINTYFQYYHIKGEAFLCDLGSQIPEHQVQIALILKMIPCLEQTDKSIGKKIMQAIKAEHILVSFPVHSLGGRSKGMRQHYTQHFNELITGEDWKVTAFDFDTEMAFFISR